MLAEHGRLPEPVLGNLGQHLCSAARYLHTRGRLHLDIKPSNAIATGGVARVDERGYVYLIDRKKDLIMVSGLNVFPNEVEDVLAHMPGVIEVAAIGVPDEHSGEVPKIFVVRRDPNLTSEDLMAFCRENFTGYKRPRHIEFRTELPKSNVGKILRRELRDEADH